MCVFIDHEELGYPKAPNWAVLKINKHVGYGENWEDLKFCAAFIDSILHNSDCDIDSPSVDPPCLVLTV